MLKIIRAVSLYRLLPACLLVNTVAFSVAAKPLYQIENQLLSGKMASQSGDDLCHVAKGTLNYLNKGASYDPVAIRDGVLAQWGGDLAKTRQTLEFICEISRQDKATGANRLADPEFINRHFTMVRWLPDKSQSAKFEAGKPLLKNIPDDKILLTKYYIKLAKGSERQSSQTPHALYSLPVDEQDLSFAQAEAKRAELIRYRFTKHQVLDGVLDENHWANPLLWLSRADLEDTLMQGTVKVDIAGGSRYFNVHRNNGIGYERGLKKEQQKRYWYFKETPGPLGYGKDADYKIPVSPYVTVAGDIAHLGLGKLILLTHNNEHRLTILADTGGAFEDNQYQLDYLGGYFRNWQHYRQFYKTFPDYFEARFLLLKADTLAEVSGDQH